LPKANFAYSLRRKNVSSAYFSVTHKCNLPAFVLAYPPQFSSIQFRSKMVYARRTMSRANLTIKVN